MRHLAFDEGAFEDEALASLKNLVAVLFRLEQIATLCAIAEIMGDLIAWSKDAGLENIRRG